MRATVVWSVVTGIMAPLAAWSAEPVEMPLYSGEVPLAAQDDQPEQVVERGAGIPDRSISHVHTPTLTIHLAPDETRNGIAFVICPGGGYARVVVDKEGHDVARWLNTLGVSAFVLKFRPPRPDAHPQGHAIPSTDARRAMRVVRSRAAEWGLDSARIGIMGFSAGGHLASTVATRFDGGDAEATDPVERYSCRPDLAVLLYPVVSMDPQVTHGGSRTALLGTNPSDELTALYSNEQQVTEDAPPMFLVHTGDDSISAENSARLAIALRRHKIPCELHIFPTGGHGYGLRKIGHPVENWPALCEAWLNRTVAGMALVE